MTASPRAKLLHVGVVDQSAPSWTAGGTFTNVTLRSLQVVSKEQALRLTLFSTSRAGSALDVATVPLEPLSAPRFLSFPGSARLRAVLGLTDPSSPFLMARKHDVDVLLPPLDVPPWRPGVATIAWIPDLQHHALPSNFSTRDLEHRESVCRRVARYADLVLASSAAVREDLRRFYPEMSLKVRVASFPSVLAFERIAGEPGWARRQYGLPERFVLVANQFWRHKNHALVIDALALLKARGVSVAVAMVGAPIDYRDPGNQSFSLLLQRIASTGVHGDVRVLGEIPAAALHDLLRTATVVLQPSLFEGWGTTVEDALTLGRPVVCSDLPVHREHAPSSVGFFDPASAEGLADVLARIWPMLPAGPNAEAEAAGRVFGEERARQYGERLAGFCREAASRRG